MDLDENEQIKSQNETDSFNKTSSIPNQLFKNARKRGAGYLCFHQI